MEVDSEVREPVMRKKLLAIGMAAVLAHLTACNHPGSAFPDASLDVGILPRAWACVSPLARRLRNLLAALLPKSLHGDQGLQCHSVGHYQGRTILENEVLLLESGKKTRNSFA